MIDTLLTFAKRYAEDNMNGKITPAHLLKAVLHKDMGLTEWVENDLQKDYYYLLEWADAQIMVLEKTTKHSDLEMTDEVVAVISEAENYCEQIGLRELNAECILAALVTPGVGFSFVQLKTLPLTAQEVLNGMSNSSTSGISQEKRTTRGDNKYLSKYCIEWTSQIRNGEVYPIIGFEREILSIFEILGRKTKAHLLVTGEAGVGKTALLKGFTQRLIREDAPAGFKGLEVYELDLSLLTSGTSYKGEVEDRMKGVFEELGSAHSILIIESIDRIFDKQDMLYGIVTMLKRELRNSNFSLLCTCSVAGFTKNIETDKEFTRLIDKISLEQPDDENCLRILKGGINQYEQYHGIKTTEDVLIESIRLSKRYLAEKSLPDAAFDLLDRTMSQINVMKSISEADISGLMEELTDIEKSQTAPDTLKKLDWLYYKVFNKISCILTSQLEDDVDFAKIESVSERIMYLSKVIDKMESLAREPRTNILSSDLFAIVAKQTGIPLGKVQSKERDKLVNGENILKRRVVGQDHAVKIVLDAIYESRSGMNKKGQPMGSFFFLGPTGTGKTELSKSLVEFLFGDEQALIRFDMSEFKEEHSVALLYGAPPGYVGYEEGGLLVNKIRQNPYSVVLFDEIEKAHKSVFDIFLQILDEGKLHDRLGRVGDFSNALILFTSNIGSQYIVDSFSQNKIPTNNDLMRIMEGHFRPEFLGRLTEIVPFAPITEQTVVKIFDIHLKGLLKQLEEQHIQLNLDEETKHAVAMAGYNPQFGARPIIGTIRKYLRRPLSSLIIKGKVTSGDNVDAKWTGDKLTFYVNNNEIE